MVLVVVLALVVELDFHFSLVFEAKKFGELVETPVVVEVVLFDSPVEAMVEVDSMVFEGESRQEIRLEYHLTRLAS